MPFSAPFSIPSNLISSTLKKLGDGTALVRIGSEFRVIQVDPGLIRKSPHLHFGGTVEEALGSSIAHTEGKSLYTPVFKSRITFGTQQWGERKFKSKVFPCTYLQTTFSDPPPFWRGVATTILLGDHAGKRLQRRSFFADGSLYGDHDEAVFIPFRLASLRGKRPFYESDFVSLDDLSN